MKVGSRVRILDSIQVGIITEIIDDMAYVKLSTGVACVRLAALEVVKEGK